MPLMLTGVLGAVRATAVTSGRVVLDAAGSEQAARSVLGWTPAERARFVNLQAEELSGGHTIAKHVGRTEAELRTRLASELNIPAASSFKTLAESERFVSRAAIQNASQIRADMSKLPIGRTRRYIFDAGEPVGLGVVRQTNTLQVMNKVRIVIMNIASKKQVYFMLTCYPDI